MHGRVLAVAGSDSGGGAGIQADLKTLSAFGAYAATAITALTAQDTRGVHGILPVPAAFVRAQMLAALDDIGADAVKTGMLGGAETVAAVCDILAPRGLKLVVDPVMAAGTGSALLDPDAVAVLRGRLLPMATLLTPNLPEAEALLGIRIADLPGMRDAALRLRAMGPRAVLLKGGHLPGGETVTDVLATADGAEAFSAPRLPGPSPHGTGCTLASAIAAGLAQGMALRAAVLRARAYLRAAIASAPGLGAGCGPLNHAAPVPPHPPGTSPPGTS